MALSSTGLTVETYEEVLDNIVTSEQENVSPQIEVGDDTSLGETNKIMASQISSVNQLLQDIYDQRDIYEAEGTALDDNISWLGLTRQSAVATSGEQYFIGDDGTTISQGSYVKSDSTGAQFTLDTAVTIDKDTSRGVTVEVLTEATNGSGYTYSVSVSGVQSQYVYVDDDGVEEIIAGLWTDLDDNSETQSLYELNTYTAGDTTIDITTADGDDISISIDSYLELSSVITAGNITGTETGAISASANSVNTIQSPTSGWDSTYNPLQLTIGRDEETDAELRVRAINYRSSSGKATVDSIKAEVLNVDGVSSISLNEQFVSDGAGAGTITIDDNSDATYTVTINGEDYSYTSTSETAIQIAGNLALVIDPLFDGRSGNGLLATDNGDGTITVSSSTLYRINMTDNTSLLTATEGQPSGSMQAVVSGGSKDDIAKALWDSKPGGVEFWALDDPSTYQEGETEDKYGNTKYVEFNRADQVQMTVVITYDVFDSSVYPDDEEDAKQSVRDSVEEFGNALDAGATITPGEFEGTVYSAVNGIYNVYIQIDGGGYQAASDDSGGVLTRDFDLDPDEQAYFVADETYIQVNQ